MADLFVSYKSEDRPSVRPLVGALTADGLTVWWDAQIEAGAEWRHAIQTELDLAKCVLVAWTRRSVGPEGRFVRDEATRALRRGVYLPVLIEKVEPPLGFGEMQALSLVGWKGDRADPRYQAVLAAARALVSGAARPAGAGHVAAAPAVGRRAMIGGGVALGVVALGGTGWWLRGRGGARTDSIAVLPFANLSGDPARAYFSDGIAEELRSALARIAGLKVAARTSSEKVRDDDVKEAASKLNVAHVLTGSVRKGDGMIRVAAQLVDGRDGLETWSQSYDRSEGDAIKLQTGIAESVANALSLTLGTAKAMLGGTTNPAAYDAYLRGVAIQTISAAAFRARLAAFDAAIAADPNFAAAHANRAFWIGIIAGESSPEESAALLAGGKAASARAIALAPTLPLGHVALGRVQQTGLDLRGADASYRKALALPGVSARDLSTIAGFESYLGRGAEALALADRAINLDPLNPSPVRRRIDVLYRNRQYREALATTAVYDRANPDTPSHPYLTAMALIFSGDPKAALPVAARSEETWVRYTCEAIAYAKLGDQAGSDQALAALKAIDGGSTYQLAEVYAVRGAPELAFAQLARALAVRDPGLIELKTDPAVDSLRADPRFAAIVAKLGFPPV
ncbi:TIR domain-containing protein [Phenylobacterium sp.]|uniref:TIR domain-containing protein n=1 Tax=Phenylobacterium sp. TaxID=1871053 RepID=UPI00286C78B8|nr:TIR domain-containing protein [Phenylobacterium sp.]